MHKSAMLSSRYRALLLAANLFMFVLIILGGIVRVNNSGGACPDWPTCLGQWQPPSQTPAVLDYAHRAASLATAAVVFPLLWMTYRRKEGHPLLTSAVFLAGGLLIIQIGVGAFVALQHQSTLLPMLTVLHLAFSLLAQASLGIAAAAAFSKTPIRIENFANSPFARLSLASLAALFILMTSGALVTASGASPACPDWPLCSGTALPTDILAWISFSHRIIVLLTGALIGMLTIQAWKIQRTNTAVLVSTTAASVLFFAQALLGAKMADGQPAYLLALHLATSIAAWIVLAIQALSAWTTSSEAEMQNREAIVHHRRNLARDYLMLTKPIVVLLLLVTTYAGMVIGAKTWPSATLTFWTLLGGFMAAGGSGAINQYIDRFDDLKMQRTQKRPIPAGRLTSAEGLAFGVGMALASFYLMAAFVNFLAALLSLAGILYYVLLYSIFLKKTTVQNIVIGGGAGAIPPLVGWAAATGSLNFPSLLLFAVIFMWTPPHFWALALVRKNDYARAGVPMLPVVRGEAETRWQIFIYTIELVGLSLLLPVLGLGGSIYLVGATMLGGWLIMAAWKVWKQEGHKVAWKMYRYSSMYLAFLFFVLMIDRLLL